MTVRGEPAVSVPLNGDRRFPGGVPPMTRLADPSAVTVSMYRIVATSGHCVLRIGSAAGAYRSFQQGCARDDYDEADRQPLPRTGHEAATEQVGTLQCPHRTNQDQEDAEREKHVADHAKSMRFNQQRRRRVAES
jgi:hypothetical protein